MAALMKLMLVLALVFGGSAGTVGAARTSLPGSPLYGIKIQLEAWDLARMEAPEDLAQAALAATQARVGELVQLVQQDRPVPSQLAQRYQEQIALAVQVGGVLDNESQLRWQNEFSRALQMQHQMMEQAAERVRVRASGGENGPIQAMIRALVQARAAVGAEGDGEGPGAPALGQPDDRPASSPNGPAYRGPALDDDDRGWGPNTEADPIGPNGPDAGEVEDAGGALDTPTGNLGYGPGTGDNDGEEQGHGPPEDSGDGIPDGGDYGFGAGADEDGDPPDEGPEGYGPGDGVPDGGEPPEEGYGPGGEPESHEQPTPPGPEEPESPGPGEPADNKGGEDGPPGSSPGPGSGGK